MKPTLSPTQKALRMATRTAAATALAATLAIPAARAQDTALPGYTDGAEVMQIDVQTGQVDLMSNLVYTQAISTTGTRQLQMSLLVPRNSDLKPAILYFPGGGFISANHDKYIQMRLALANAGFVVASAEYRVVPDRFPAPITDAKAAVRYLRAHAADFGIDPDRIGVIGDSAGGYVAQMLGVTNGETAFDTGTNLDQSSAVQAAATLYGISNLLNIGEGFPDTIAAVHASPAVTEALLVNGPAFATFPGASITADPDKALAASPMGHVAGTTTPFLIMHGTADTIVSPLQSEQLYTALSAENTPATYILLQGATHGDATWYQQPVIDLVVNWFKTQLGAPIAGAGRAADANSNL